MRDRTSEALVLAECHLASLLLSEEDLNPLAVLFFVVFFFKSGLLRGSATVAATGRSC